MTKLNDAQEVQDCLKWREQNLMLTKFCLERYKETKDEFYLEQAKEFGEWSAKIKKNYL